jgi:hypothetical protein
MAYQPCCCSVTLLRLVCISVLFIPFHFLFFSHLYSLHHIPLMQPSYSMHLYSCALPPCSPLNPPHNNNLISSLLHLLIVFVVFVHAIFTMLLHAHSTPNSSTTRVLCLIIIVTLHLLWWFTPRVQHHCMLY